MQMQSITLDQGGLLSLYPYDTYYSGNIVEKGYVMGLP